MNQVFCQSHSATCSVCQVQVACTMLPPTACSVDPFPASSRVCIQEDREVGGMDFFSSTVDRVDDILSLARKVGGKSSVKARTYVCTCTCPVFTCATGFGSPNTDGPNSTYNHSTGSLHFSLREVHCRRHGHQHLPMGPGHHFLHCERESRTLQRDGVPASIQ